MELLLVFDPKRFVFRGYNLTRITFEGLLMAGKRCGDKVVGKGEECDCSSKEDCKNNECCQPDCKLKHDANCSFAY
eukprot:bmy_15107T0